MEAIFFDVICTVAVFIFGAVLWQLYIEARGDREEDEHERGFW